MRRIRQLILKVRRILDMDAADVASLPALWRYTSNVFHFGWQVSAKFISDRCIQRASALGYATLLAIVPLLVLGVSVLAGFQVFDTYADQMISSAINYFVPTSQNDLQGYFKKITAKSGTLSVFGIVGLLVTVTALLNTVEEAFNDIWNVNAPRPLLSKFVAFWSLLTLSPLLMAASLSITSYFTAMPILHNVAEGASNLQHIPFVLPWLISTAAITTLYKTLPNTNVSFRHALLGGMIAGALFELTKFGFTLYVTKMANYEKIYGALGALPVFLVWLYLAWFVVLIGAEVSYCLQHPRQSKRLRQWHMQAGVRHFYQHLILLRAAASFNSGRVLLVEELVAETGLDTPLLTQWFDQLEEQGLLRRLATPQNGWILAHNPALLSLYHIHHHLEAKPMNVPEQYRQSSLGSTLNELYRHLNQEQKNAMAQINLQQLIDEENQRKTPHEVS